MYCSMWISWFTYEIIVGSVPVNPQTGQPDYTAQWIQYYRSIGAMKDAEALEQQLKASKVCFCFGY